MSAQDIYPVCTCGCGGPGSKAHGMCDTGYKQWRRRQIAYGRWRVRVPVDAARAHVERLMDAGLRPAQVADLAGVHPGTIRNILLPETENISADSERAVLAVAAPARPGDVVSDVALVPIHGARRRVQALIAYGYPQTHLARELGIAHAHAAMGAFVERRAIRARGGKWVSASLERAVKALFDRLQMIPGPSQDAREYGREREWALPFEWDEEALDDPQGQPTRARYRRVSTEKDRSERDANTAERRSRVVELTHAGLTSNEIAVQLRISQRTVVRDRRYSVAEARHQEAS